MRKIYLLILMSILVLMSACSKSNSSSDEILTIEDLLVQDNEITGWEYSGVSWVASSISELTDYINGMAELYQTHGFTEGAQQSYGGTIDGTSCTIQLIIYNMDTEENAKDMYNDPDLGLSAATTWTDGAGEEAHYVCYGGLSQVLTFYDSSYFVYLQIGYDSDESLNVLKQFALNVDGKIEDEAEE